MSVDKKIIILVILLLSSSFSGCTLLNRTEFKLISLDIEDDNGFASMSISFNITNKVALKLIDPAGNLLFNDDFYRGTHTTEVDLDEYRITPQSGTYNLKAYDGNNNVIFQKKLSYEDQDLVIIDVNEQWWLEDSKHSLVGLSITLKNQGDLPAYPYSADVQINNKVTSGLFIPTAVLPQKSTTAHCFVYLSKISSIKQLLEISVKNSEGTIIANDSMNVFPSENISQLTFRWRYQGSNSLVIPNIAFLYNHYNSLDRLDTEDYAVYVFDRYDDQYIDLVTKRITSLIDSSKDVEIINFITSFVQDLNYIEDATECDYPRYPIELLKDAKGDCEDKAILTASILDSLGYNVSLLKIPNHVAVGVRLSKSATAFDYYIDQYYFLETTSTGWVLGKVPPEHDNEDNITVYQISNRPLLIHSWKNATRFSTSDGEDYVKLKIIVENLGRKTANNFNIWGAFFNQGTYFNQKETSEISLLEDMKKFVNLKMDVPQILTTQLKTQVYLNNKIVHERESTSSFP